MYRRSVRCYRRIILHVLRSGHLQRSRRGILHQLRAGHVQRDRRGILHQLRRWLVSN